MKTGSDKSVVTHALCTVMADPGLRAMVLSGPWGVGKTYLVNDFFAQHRAEVAQAGLQYAYVSLHGLQSSAEVRSQLATAVITKEGTPTRRRWLQKLLRLTPYIGNLGWVDVSRAGDLARSVIENQTVRHLFVCIDDLERAGAGLQARDVLGLISELVEQRSCKCALLLNRDKLHDPQFPLMEEKVFDFTIDYRPSAGDVIALGLPRAVDQGPARPVFDAFGSANIRVMRRLDWMLREIRCCGFADLDRIWPTVVGQAAVFAILKHEHGCGRAALEKLAARDVAQRFTRDIARNLEREPVPDFPPEIETPLDELDFEAVGFGKHLVDLLEHGSFDPGAMREDLGRQLAHEQSSTQAEQMRSLYGETRRGFSEYAPAFISRLQTFLDEDLDPELERQGLVGLCEMLLELAPGEAAEELVRRKLARLTASASPDDRARLFQGFPKIWASGLLERIPYEAPAPTIDLTAAFAAVAQNPAGWDPKFGELNEFSEDQLRAFFLSLRGPDVIVQIARARTRAARADELSEAARQQLGAKIDRVMAQIVELDPLFALKVAEYRRLVNRRKE